MTTLSEKTRDFALLSSYDRIGRSSPRVLLASSAISRLDLPDRQSTVHEWSVENSAKDFSESVIPGRDIPMNWEDLDGTVSNLLSRSRDSLVETYRSLIGRRPSKRWSDARIVSSILRVNAYLADQTAILFVLNNR